MLRGFSGTCADLTTTCVPPHAVYFSPHSSFMVRDFITHAPLNNILDEKDTFLSDLLLLTSQNLFVYSILLLNVSIKTYLEVPNTFDL